MTDLASFAPSPVILTSEPEGFGVVGIPVDFLAPVAQHTAAGTLFDLPVTVRFTPTAATVSPGDGTHLRASIPAAVTHTFRARGTHTATAVIEYTADVDYGAGWIPVPGILTVPTSAHTLSVLEARSALVQHTCAQDPHAPGC